jgi:hypothetical protein
MKYKAKLMNAMRLKKDWKKLTEDLSGTIKEFSDDLNRFK